MPWWASLYLAGYVAFTLWSVIDDIKTKDNTAWFVAAEVFGDICLLVAGLAFWRPEIQTMFGSLLIPAFAAGLAVLLVQVVSTVRRSVLADPELSFSGKLFVGVAGSMLVAGVSAPLIYWGFNAAVLRHAGV